MRTDIALLALHLQNEIVDAEGSIGKRGNAAQVAQRRVLENAGRLMATARRNGLPIIHVGSGYLRAHPGTMSAAPHFAAAHAQGLLLQGSWSAGFPEMVAPQAGDAVLYHTGIGPFQAEGLDALLRCYGIKALMQFGVSTRLVVEASVFEATDRGYTSYVVEDCCAAAKSELHEQAIEIIKVFGDVLSSHEAEALIS